MYICPAVFASPASCLFSSLTVFLLSRLYICPAGCASTQLAIYPPSWRYIRPAGNMPGLTWLDLCLPSFKYVRLFSWRISAQLDVCMSTHLQEKKTDSNNFICSCLYLYCLMKSYPCANISTFRSLQKPRCVQHCNLTCLRLIHGG